MRERLEALGLKLAAERSGTRAILSLEGHPILNPLTRRALRQVVFSVSDNRLLFSQPPELVGIAPINASHLAGADELEERVHAVFNDLMLQLQRTTNQLQAMGIQPRVEPGTLQLTAELKGSEHDFLIAQDKRGIFRVARARRQGVDLDVSAGHAFDLSEFRERSALLGYLVALVGGEAGPDHPHPRGAAPVELEGLISYAELARRLGHGAMLPPHSPVDVLMMLEARGQSYRFAAARVTGRTFRGLLAGSSGKLWAERFELESFGGPVKLLAELLGIPEAEVRVLAGEPV